MSLPSRATTRCKTDRKTGSLWWKGSSIPMYMSIFVCLREEEGYSQTLQRNYLLPISPNLEQARDDTPVAGVEQTRTLAPEPSVDSESTNQEPSGMAASNTTGNTSQSSQDQPGPLRCGTPATQNQPPWQGSTAILHYQQISA